MSQLEWDHLVKGLFCSIRDITIYFISYSV